MIPDLWPQRGHNLTDETYGDVTLIQIDKNYKWTCSEIQLIQTELRPEGEEGELGEEGVKDKQPHWLLKTSDKENILKAARGKDI